MHRLSVRSAPDAQAAFEGLELGVGLLRIDGNGQVRDGAARR